MKSRDWGAAGGGTSIAIAVAFASCSVAAVMHLLSTPVFSIAAFAGGLASLVALVVAWRSPRLANGAAIGTACALAPSIFVGCLAVGAAPLATTRLRCGTGDLAAPFVFALAVFLGAAFGLPVSALANRFGPKLHRVGLAFATAAWLASAAIVALGLASLARPQPDDFAQLLDEYVPLELGQTIRVGETTLACERRSDAVRQPTPSDRYGVGVDGRMVRLLPTNEVCTLRISRGASTSRISLDAVDGSAGGGTSQAPNDERCPRLTVAHDPQSDVGLVMATSSPWTARPIAILGHEYPNDAVYASDFRGRLGAPRGWVVGGVLGFFLAAIALGAAFRAARRAGRLDRFLEATHGGGGWLTLDGATSPRHVPALEGSEPGPVLVAPESPSRAATYRDDGSPRLRLVATGTRATVRDALRSRAFAWACVAIATLATTSAPLWAARLRGIL